MLRKISVLALAIALLLLPGAAPSSATPPDPSPDTVVYPTGTHPEDLETVQAAVDGGGVVLLKATDASGAPTAFDFGPKEPGNGIVLTTDVEIVGETTREARTTIRGGVLGFIGTSKHQTRISGIHFAEQGLSAAIWIASTGVEFTDNVVTGVTGVESLFGLTEGRGIKFLGNNDPAGAITGRIEVEDNVFRGFTSDLSDAIVLDRVAADVRIARNEITAVESSGVLVIAGTGDVEIERNVIAPGPGVISPISTGNGVFLVGGGGDGSHRIIGNDIDSANPWADGILVVGFPDFGGYGDLEVSRNAVTMGTEATPGFFGAITMIGDVTGAVIESNRIDGNASLGIDLLLDGETAVAPVDSVFTGNNIARFEATDADVLFDTGTSGNVLAGNGGHVVDLGGDNHVTGSSFQGEVNLGRQIGPAKSRKLDLVFGD